MKCPYTFTRLSAGGKNIEYNLNLGEDFIFMGDDPCSICNSTTRGLRNFGFALEGRNEVPKIYEISICEDCTNKNFIVI
tara:strand:+ start:49 stop:285 length:237 start_codon:yes stop_codon:yes gene_type:complete